MRKTKARSTKVTIIIIVVTVLLGGIGIYIAYTIYKARQITPEKTEAATCCSCKWVDPSQTGQSYHYEIAHTLGIMEGEKCVILKDENNQPIISSTAKGDVKIANPSTCRPVDAPSRDRICEIYNNDKDKLCDPCYHTDENGNCTGTHTCCGCHGDDECKNCFGCVEEWEPLIATVPCDPGCIASTVDPTFDPNDPTGDVTFTGQFELKYALPGNDKYTNAELEFVYPTGGTAPEKIEVEVTESMVTRSYNEGGDENKPIKIYAIPFETTWEDVIDEALGGTFTVRMRAQDLADEWTDYIDLCTFEFEIPSDEDSYCSGLEVLPADPTVWEKQLNAQVSNLLDGASPTYHWRMDLNCDGTIDEETQGQNAEVRDSTSASISAEFSPPLEEEGPYEDCQVAVQIELDGRTLSERPTGSCSDSITLQQASPDCGDGVCNTGETCDPDDDTAIDCVEGDNYEEPLPSGTECRQDCTYCGDGILNGSEACDPEIPEGETGYDANCQADCTIEGEEPGEFVVTKQGPDCVELVSPNNIATFTIRVANSGDTSQTIRAVSDTLPQNFTYNTGSSIINGTANTSDTGVTVETSGDSQLITWDNSGTGWVIDAGGTLVIQFSATAGANATIGNTINETTVTPSDDDPIPATYTFQVAQTCTQPDTGIFDNNVLVILVGTGFLLLAGSAYYTGFGSKTISKLLTTVSATGEDLLLKIKQPQKYSEKKIAKSALKKISKHLDDKKKSKKKKKS